VIAKAHRNWFFQVLLLTAAAFHLKALCDFNMEEYFAAALSNGE
jgi:hypothetical protein